MLDGTVTAREFAQIIDDEDDSMERNLIDAYERMQARLTAQGNADSRSEVAANPWLDNPNKRCRGIRHLSGSMGATSAATLCQPLSDGACAWFVFRKAWGYCYRQFPETRVDGVMS